MNFTKKVWHEYGFGEGIGPGEVLSRYHSAVRKLQPEAKTPSAS